MVVRKREKWKAKSQAEQEKTSEAHENDVEQGD